MTLMKNYKSAPEFVWTKWKPINYGQLMTRALICRAMAQGETSEIVLRNLTEEETDAELAAAIIADSIVIENGEPEFAVSIFTAEDEDGHYYAISR